MTDKTKHPRKRTSKKTSNPNLSLVKNEQSSSGSSTSTRGKRSKSNSARSSSRSTSHGSRKSVSSKNKDSRQGTKIAKPKKGLVYAIVVVILVVIAAVAFYKPSKEYYLAYRESQRLNAYLEAVQDYNNTLESKVQSLQTEEGIEDAARKNLGYVKEGENAVTLTGLDEETAVALPQEKDIEPPHTWWTNILDALYGVDTAAVSKEEAAPQNSLDKE